MGTQKTEVGIRAATAEAGEGELRGTALDGSEQQRAADHTAYKKTHNPDTVLRVDDEKDDDLYDDGLELDDDTPPLGTDGRSEDNAR